MAPQNVRRSVSMSQATHDQLMQLVRQRGKGTTESSLLREAIQQFLEQQTDILASKLHFQQSFRERLDHVEAALSFHLNIVIYLLAAMVPDADDALDDAIIAARRDGETLLEQIRAVRDLSNLDE